VHTHLRYYCCRYYLVVLLCVFADQTPAQDTGVIEFRVSLDKGIDDIEALCCSNALFGPPVQKVFPGLGSDHTWIQLPRTMRSDVLILSHMIDRVDLYERDSNSGKWRVSSAGDSTAPTGSALNTTRVAFALSDTHSPTHHRYMRLVHPAYVNVSLSLDSREALFTTLDRQLVFRALLLGFVSAIVLYNLTLAIINRDSVFALNAVAVSSLIGVDLYLTGYGMRHLWPYEWSNHLLNIFLGVAVIAGSRFICQFLHPGGDNMADHRLVLWTGYAAMAILLAGLVLPYWIVQTLMLVNIALFMLLTLTVVLNHFFHGNENALPIFIPLAIAIIPGGLFVYLVRSGVLSGLSFGPHLLVMTLALEALAFSLALGSRIRILSREADTAKRNLSAVALTAARNYSQLQDKERANIASDLHDSIGHDLVMIKAYLGQARNNDTAIEQAQHLATDTLAAVRRLSHELHPAQVELVGWHRAVADLFASLRTSSYIETTLTGLNREPAIDAVTKLHLYRILQEVISNITKHAQASRCWFVIEHHPDHLLISVEDDGSGHDDSDDRQPGLGLISIDQRVVTIGGQWGIGKRAAGGTRIWIRVPLDNDND